MLKTSRQIRNGEVSAAKAKAEDAAREALAEYDTAKDSPAWEQLGPGYFRDSSSAFGHTEPNHPTVEPSIIMRSDLEAIRKAVQEEMLRVRDMEGGRRVETCLQLDSARSDYGWLYARHADGQ